MRLSPPIGLGLEAFPLQVCKHICMHTKAGTNKAVSKDQAHVKTLEEQIRELFVLKPRELEDSCSTASESSPSVDICAVETLSDGKHSKSRSRSRSSRSRSYSRSSSANSDSTDDEPGRDQTDPKGPKDTKDAVPGPASVSSARRCS